MREQEQKISWHSFLGHGVYTLCITGCTVVQHCYKADEPFQWKSQNSTPSPVYSNPLTYQHPNWHMWLRPPYLSICKIGLESVHGGSRLSKYVKYNDFVLFSFPSLCFLQRVSIACYAERCISHDRFCLTVRPSDRLSHAGIMPKRLQLRSCGLHWRIAPWL